ADSNGALAHLELVRVGKGEVWVSGAVDLYERDVIEGIKCNYFRGVLFPVVRVHRVGGLWLIDDVLVGHNEAIGRDEKARTAADLLGGIVTWGRGVVARTAA